MRIDNVKTMSVGTDRVNRIELDSKVVYRRRRFFTVRAKPYPEDGYAPVARMEEDGVAITPQISRSWTFFVWDSVRGLWATDLDYAGARAIDRSLPIPAPRYDTWDVAVATAQQQAFCDAIDLLADGRDIIIVGTHAPENYSAAMVTRMKRCGGSDANLSWTARNSYILVGRTGLGAGNAYHEVLNNVTLNGKSNSAQIDIEW
jgi:hypothetical protein